MRIGLDHYLDTPQVPLAEAVRIISKGIGARHDATCWL